MTPCCSSLRMRFWSPGPDSSRRRASSAVGQPRVLLQMPEQPPVQGIQLGPRVAVDRVVRFQSFFHSMRLLNYSIILFAIWFQIVTMVGGLCAISALSNASIISSSSSAMPGRRRCSTRPALASTGAPIEGSRPAAATWLRMSWSRAISGLCSPARSAPIIPPQTSSRSMAMASASSRSRCPTRQRHSTKRRAAAPSRHAARGITRREGRSSHGGHPAVWRHAHQICRARRLRGNLCARISALPRARHAQAACSEPSTTSSATSSWARWRNGFGSLQRRWGLRSSCTSTTRRSRRSTRP